MLIVVCANSSGDTKKNKRFLMIVPPKVPSVLVALVCAFGVISQLFGVSAPVKSLVPKEFKSRTVPVVSSRFRDHIDDAVSSAYLLGCKPVGDHLEFLD